MYSGRRIIRTQEIVYIAARIFNHPDLIYIIHVTKNCVGWNVTLCD